MDFHGHINLRDNEMQKMVLQAETTFPTPTVGRLCFKDSRVWICIDATTPVWAPLSAMTNTYVHNQTSSSLTWTVTHNLNTVSPIVQVYDSTDKMIIPNAVYPSSNNEIIIELETSAVGHAVVMSGLPEDPAISAVYGTDPYYNYTQNLKAYYKMDDTIVVGGAGPDPLLEQYEYRQQEGGIALVWNSASGWSTPTDNNLLICELWYYGASSIGGVDDVNLTKPNEFTGIFSDTWTVYYNAVDWGFEYWERFRMELSWKKSQGDESYLQSSRTGGGAWDYDLIFGAIHEFSGINAVTTPVAYDYDYLPTNGVPALGGYNSISTGPITVGTPTYKRFYVAGVSTLFSSTWNNGDFTEYVNPSTNNLGAAYYLGGNETSLSLTVDFGGGNYTTDPSVWLIAFDSQLEVDQLTVLDSVGTYNGIADNVVSTTGKFSGGLASGGGAPV